MTQRQENIRYDKLDKNGVEVHKTMKDNVMRTATETQEDANGGAVEMRDNGDSRQGHRLRQRPDKHGGRDAGQQA